MLRFPASPLNFIEVDSHLIGKSCKLCMTKKKFLGSKWALFHTALPGDWDKINQQGKGFVNNPIYTSMPMRLLGESWQSLPVFEYKMKAIVEKGQVDGCYSKSDLIKGYAKLDAVIETS